MPLPVTKLRKRFQQLRDARDSGSVKRPEQLWNVWKVQIETWSHEYWLLKLELTEMKRMYDCAHPKPEGE